jgi:predicted ester cyclase
MASRNVETLRAAHESWNKRDFAGVMSNAVKGLAYTDHGRNITLNTRDKFREWTEGWAKAFSDGRITNPEYIDAGDIVVPQFTVEGTNDGPLGSLKPTGRKMSLPFCEICHFDKQGPRARMVSGGCYYDQYTLLTQLGHIQPLAVAA